MFRVGRMRTLYAAMLQQAIAAGVEWLPETTYAGVDRRDDHCEVRFLVCELAYRIKRAVSPVPLS